MNRGGAAGPVLRAVAVELQPDAEEESPPQLLQWLPPRPPQHQRQQHVHCLRICGEPVRQLRHPLVDRQDQQEQGVLAVE